MPLRFILSMMLSIFFSPCCSKLWKQSDGGRVHDDPQEATFEAASPILPSSCSSCSSCSAAEQHPAIGRLDSEWWWWCSILRFTWDAHQMVRSGSQTISINATPPSHTLHPPVSANHQKVQISI